MYLFLSVRGLLQNSALLVETLALLLQCCRFHETTNGRSLPAGRILVPSS